MQNEIAALEKQIWELNSKLAEMRKKAQPVEVKNYKFKTLDGEVSLLELFAGKDVLFAIHNMGQGCRYCTLWADGINAFLPHLEDRFSVVLLSKDSPETQRRFANSRNWRFRMASHGGDDYIREQSVDQNAKDEGHNSPGLVCYVRDGDKILKKNFTQFGPGDHFSTIWSILSLAGFNDENWTPQYNYWRAPAKLDDGGANLR